MAPLKLDEVAGWGTRDGFPFHLDDEVAPLKHLVRKRAAGSDCFAFHLDDEVAPLKPARQVWRVEVEVDDLPPRRRGGPIEATLVSIVRGKNGAALPPRRRGGPIEARCR